MKLALVTGGHRRLGAAISSHLARGGWTLALHGAHDATPDEALRTTLVDWHGFVADLSDEAAVARLIPEVVDHFGVLPSLLVNNASMFDWDDLATATPGNMAAHHAVNAAAPVALCLALAQAGGSGSIVNILDQRVRNPNADQLSYTLSKTALAAATRTLAVTLAPGLRVNAVAPGLTLATPAYDADKLARVASAMPLRRLPDPTDIAAAVAFLAASPAITGQTLFVDAGASLKSFERDFVYF